MPQVGHALACPLCPKGKGAGSVSGWSGADWQEGSPSFVRGYACRKGLFACGRENQFGDTNPWVRDTNAVPPFVVLHQGAPSAAMASLGEPIHTWVRRHSRVAPPRRIG